MSAVQPTLNDLWHRTKAWLHVISHTFYLTSLLSLIPYAGFAEVNWNHYAGDAASTKFAPISQIDGTNFNDLRIIWQWQMPDAEIMDANEDVRPNFSNRVTPIVVDGVLYTSTPLNLVVALDAQSGEELWRFDPESWRLETFYVGLHRGVSYWTDGEQKRILFGTFDGYLYSLDAHTGQPDPAFGNDGRIDLTQGLDRPVERWAYALPSPPIICRDVLITGSSVIDWRAQNGRLPDIAPPGDVRGYDVRSGELLWTFHAIPREGEFGVDTWPEEAWKQFGGTNVWSILSADDELGYVYLPFSTPSNDFYGGDRPGNNLFGDSIVCLDVRNGQRIWHYQLVHHGLWDYDTPAAPVLLDIVVDGQPIKAVAQVTKQGFCFVFNRVTGEPVWPIEERPVPPSTVPGEQAAPTQPFPTWPLPFDRQGLSEDDLIDFTPQLKAAALEIYKRYDHGPLFTPPSLKGTITLPGQAGGAHWGGATADPRRGLLFIPSRTDPRRIWLVPTHTATEPPAYTAEIEHVKGPERLSLVKPPYGRITAIDLNTGEHVWMRAMGKGPVNHPALRHLDLPDMGLNRYMFAIATPTLVFVAPVGPNRTRGDYFTDHTSYLWALNPDNGEKVGEIPLPQRVNGSLITYETGSRQYIVLPVGWGDRAGLVALAIPQQGEALPFQAVDRDDAEHELFYDAVKAFDAGDAKRLAQLLTDNEGLVNARGYLHQESKPDYFRQATLLHHIAGNPMRAELQSNVLELTRILLRAGADPHAQTADGNSVLTLVIGADQPRWLNVQTELIELMLEAGVDANQGDGRLLHAALTDRRSAQTAKLLYEKGAQIDLRFATALNLMDKVETFFAANGSLQANALSRYHPSPTAAQMSEVEILNESLNYAAFWGNVEIGAFLLERGAEIDSQPPKVYRPRDRGRTALHAAVDTERPEMVRFLLKRGADPNVRDNNWDDTPLDWAEWGGNEEIIQMLRQAANTD